MFLWKTYAAVVRSTPYELGDTLILVQRQVQTLANPSFTKDFPIRGIREILSKTRILGFEPVAALKSTYLRAHRELSEPPQHKSFTKTYLVMI